MLARDLNYLAGDQFEQLGACCEEIRRMLTGLLKKLVAGN
jgi:hypothetical protein